jgi:short-subunit dehydrogenase
MNTALITGASSGIGKEMAYCFAKDGVQLVLTARSQDVLAEIASDIRNNFGVSVWTFAADLTQQHQAQNILRFCQENQISIQYLINNAGFGDTGFFEHTDMKKNERMIQLNITALTELCHIFVPIMKAAGFGKILNVASTAAFQPGPTMAVYFATKSYVLSFSEALNNELSGTGVTVTALCPGPTETKFAEAAGFKSDGIFDSKKKFPSAQEVAVFGYQSLLKGKSVAIHGTMNYIQANASRFFPRNWVVKITRYMMG